MASFKLIRPAKEALEPDQDRAFLWFLLFIPITCALIFWSGWVILALLLTLSAVVIRFVGFPRRLLRDWPKDSDVIGQLHVDEEGLIHSTDGDQEPVLYQDIRSAVLLHNHIKGEPLAYRDMAHNGIATLQMTMKDGHERTIKFLVERRDQVPDVEFLLRSIYKRGTRVEEFVGRHRMRTILFKHGRSFKEIQALKEELGVDGFY